MRRARLHTLVRRAVATNALGIAALGCTGDMALPTAPADAPITAASARPARTTPDSLTADTLTTESLSTDAPTRCLADGALEGEWMVRFNGFGCAAMAFDARGAHVTLSPRAAVGDTTTHAQLLLGPTAGTQLAYRVDVMTTRQLRTGAQPNPWEVAWVVWHYTDDEHFYYFIPKPNGWELGKRDPAYPGGQRFLATGSAPRYPVGRWNEVRVTQRDSTMTVHVDGVALVTFTDAERAYTAGRVGLYSEDATVVARGARID